MLATIAPSGHTDTVNAVATGVIDGHPIAVTNSDDHTVRVWDLAESDPSGAELVFPAPVTALALTSQGQMVVCIGDDVAVFTRQPAN